MLYQKLIRPALFRFDSETVHETVSGITRSVFQCPVARFLAQSFAVQDPVDLFGLTFPNRVGLAAGFDKKGQFIRAAQGLGFGHLEIGAVTPLPQAGHPRPRMFRLPEFQAVRNRMGFNNDGAAAIGRRLASSQSTIPVGVNLGKGKDTPLEDAAKDYSATLELLFPYADFFVLNVSSPNTAGLRALQSEVTGLLESAHQSNESQSQRFGIRPRPLLIKLSPDLDDDLLKSIADSAVRAGVDGIVATNTTINREPPYQDVPDLGGLSGQPLRYRSPEVVSLLRQTLGPSFPLIGVGGIDDQESARNMRQAGADLIQIYTGLIYQGPGLVPRLAKTLKEMS